MVSGGILAEAQTASSDGGVPIQKVERVRNPATTQTNNTWGLLPPGEDPHNTLGFSLIKHVAGDQERFWTSPFHHRSSKLKKALPILAFTGALIASDHWISQQVPDSPSQLRRSKTFSDYAAYSMVAGAGGSYVWGHLTQNDHLRETGILSTEAIMNSLLANYAIKGITQRPRPLEGESAGFFQGGSSFPSDHSAIAWSVAGVLAHEYPGPLTKLLAYGLASGITIARVTAKEHYASDAFVGSALGWYMGRQIYRAHHDPEVGGSGWGSTAPHITNFEERSPGNHASPYVPLDSWVYAAFGRLAAWGYLQSSMFGQRPWTRQECARLLEEAQGQVPVGDSPKSSAAAVFSALQDEFASDGREISTRRNFSVRIDSIYSRATGISGPPLTDGYNFAQTIINDYGRPFREGFNNYEGLAAEGNLGPFAFYLRGEYQHAPSAPGIPDAARQAIADAESVPVAPYQPFQEINRPRLIEGYISFALDNLQFSFGKQSLWWGPTETGPMLASTNAEPITMLRISTGEPFKLPSILSYLGPVRTEFFLGQLQGQQYILDTNGIVGPENFKPQPFIHGQKISFKPTPNVEFGFSRTVVFSGLGHPFTVHNFLKSFFSIPNHTGLNVAGDPGDRRSAFDFSYRIPYLRKWLTMYSDSFCEDDVSPFVAPQRCAWSPGLYLTKVPGLEKLDFRAEGVYTDVPGFSSPGTNYQNIIYRSGYTNNGNIIGSWIGRDGTGVQLWSTYWLCPESKLQAGFRHQSVDHKFLSGGNLDDFSVSAQLKLRHDLLLSSAAQYESWSFPLLAPGAKSNLAISVTLTFHPKWGIGR